MVSGFATWTNAERIDRSCDLLGSAYRRCIIYVLRQNGPTGLDELADAVVSSGLADDRTRAMVSLVHTHLPKLAEFDVVAYDDPEDSVWLVDDAAALEPFLTLAARQETDGEQLRSFGRDAPDAMVSNAPE